MASRPSPALVGELVGKRRYAQRECLHGCQRVREIQRERILRHLREGIKANERGLLDVTANLVHRRRCGILFRIGARQRGRSQDPFRVQIR